MQLHSTANAQNTDPCTGPRFFRRTIRVAARGSGRLVKSMLMVLLLRQRGRAGALPESPHRDEP